jgi:uncharacterized protein YaeQ
VALKSTIFKAELSVSDMDRNYFGNHSLTLARHPSETDERMMVRLLAFALHAEEYLEFGKGISSDEEPALWKKDLTGVIEEWIEVGLPDERLLRKASGRSRQVYLYCYSGRGVEVWWGQNQKLLERIDNLTVYNLLPETTQALAGLAARNMAVQCTIQDGHVWFSADDTTVEIQPALLQANSR